MNIDVTKPIPEREQLLEVLKREFNPALNYKLFGWGPGASIVVGKNSVVGVRVFLRPQKNRIIIQGAFPSIFIQALFGGLILILFVYGKWKKMEKEVGEFLSKKYA